jgi:hypothetical protein
MRGKSVELFRWSAIVILLVTAAAKLLGATGRAAILDLPDPLFGLATRQLIVGVAFVELILATVLLLPLQPQRQFLGLAWLTSNFLLYRVALAVSHPDKHCPCLGTWT